MQIPNHFENTYLDEYIVMPNHIHGIVVMKRHARLNGGNVETPKLGVSTGQTDPLGPLVSPGPANPGIPNIIDGNSGKKLSIPNYQSGSLGVIVNQFKRICTITYKTKGLNFSWQSRFYDEIIRNDNRLHQIRTYIRNNPINWNNDKNYQ